jgi:hypothetical protein
LILWQGSEQLQKEGCGEVAMASTHSNVFLMSAALHKREALPLTKEVPAILERHWL